MKTRTSIPAMPRHCRTSVLRDGDVLFCYRNMDPEALITLGLLRPSDLPKPGRGAYRRGYGNDKWRVSRCADGSLNGNFHATYLMKRDTAFQGFLARILADVNERQSGGEE